MMDAQTASQPRPFWDWMMNLKPVKRFVNLGICKRAMKIGIISKLFNYEMITYIFYGVLTTVVNIAAFWGLCLLLGAPINNPTPDDAAATFAANAGAWIIALIFAFFTNKIIVFKSKSLTLSRVAVEFVMFTAARLLSFGCESLIMYIAPLIYLNLMIAKVIAAVVVVILNYVFSKLFIFKKKEK